MHWHSTDPSETRKNKKDETSFPLQPCFFNLGHKHKTCEVLEEVIDALESKSLDLRLELSIESQIFFAPK